MILTCQKIMIILMTLALLGACSQKRARVTQARLVVGAISELQYTGGGILITGVGPGGSRFVKNISSANLSLQLVKGGWTFRAVAWDGNGSNAPMEGVMRCAFQEANLSKTNETVAINLSIANCDNAAFGGPEFRDGVTNDFLPLTLHTCSGLNQQLDSYGFVMLAPGGLCTEMAGRERSFKIRIPNIDASLTALVPTSPLISNCIGPVLAPLDAHVNSAVRLPDMGFPIEIEAYDQPGCNGSIYPPRIFNFDIGLSFATSPNDGFAMPVGSVTSVYLDSQLCGGSWLANPLFANGSDADPYVNTICTPQQLGNLFYNDPQYNTAFMTASHIYQLGQSIDISSIPAGSIGFLATSPFEGTFRGNNHSIHGGTAALFRSIGSGASIMDLEIYDFTITATTNFRGIFADTIENVGSSSSPVELESIDVNNSTLALGSTFDSAGVIGSVAGTPLKVRRFNISNTNVTGSYLTVDTNMNCGIFVGEYALSTISEIKSDIQEVEIIDSSVICQDNVGGMFGSVYNSNAGSHFLDLQDINVLGLDLTGKNSAGGIIGSYSDASGNSNLNIHRSTVASSFDEFGIEFYSSITGRTNVGGFVGYSGDFPNISIANGFSKVDLYAQAEGGGETASYFGGIVGQSKHVFMNDVHVIMTYVEQSSPALIGANSIGGIGGQIGFNNSNVSTLNNVYADVDIFSETATALKFGGLAGEFVGDAADATKAKITNSMAIGDIACLSPSSSNIGGLAGTMTNSSMRRMISHVNLSGALSIGGAIGTQIGNTAFADELFITGDIIHDGQEIGGLVGDLDGNINNAIYRGQIQDLNDISVALNECNGGAGTCGKLIGNVTNANICSNIKTDSTGSGFLYIGSDPPPILGGTPTSCSAGGTVGADIAIVNQPNIASAGNLVFISEITPFDSGLLIPGTSVAPFVITGVGAWNQAASSAYLLGKTIKLGNNIDFANNPFTVFGGSTGTPNIFSGRLIPNHRTLSNVTINVNTACTSDNCGLIRVLGEPGGKRGAVGSWSDRLVIQNFTMTCTTNCNRHSLGGIIGKVQHGDVYANIYNGNINITDGSGSFMGVGGIVGKLEDGTVSTSSYEGPIVVGPGYSGIGGVVGLIAFPDLNFHTAFVQTSTSTASISGNSSRRGGIVGYVLMNDPDHTVGIDEVYSINNSFAGNAVSNGGIVGELDFSVGGTFSLNNAIAVINTVNVLKPIVAAVNPSLPGGPSYNTIAYISNGFGQTDSFVPNSNGFSDWDAFKSSGQFASYFSGTHSEFHFDDPGIFQPKFYWEYPPGTFPFMEEF